MFFFIFFCLSSPDLSLPARPRLVPTPYHYSICIILYYFCVLCWFLSFLLQPPAELSKCLVSNCYCTPECVCVCVLTRRQSTWQPKKPPSAGVISTPWAPVSPRSLRAEESQVQVYSKSTWCLLSLSLWLFLFPAPLGPLFPASVCSPIPGGQNHTKPHGTLEK